MPIQKGLWLRGRSRVVARILGPRSRRSQPIEYLDHAAIVAGLTALARQLLIRLDLYLTVDSTNQVLLDRLANESIHGQVCLAEFQTAGRGRRGNRWITPFGAGICLSLGWRFEMPPNSLSALGLATGVGIMRVLEALGVQGVGLKWPNDVLWNGRKLGGILVEAKGGARGFTDVVIGVGLNVAFPEEKLDAIDQPWVDIATIVGRRVSRNELAARLLCALFEILEACERQGLSGFIEEWRRYDLLRGTQVALSLPNGDTIVGEAQDIDPEGALLVSVNGRIERYCSGEIQLRKVT